MWPIILSCGPFDLRSAAVFEGLAALAAMLYIRSRREDLGLDLEAFWGLVLALMLGVFVGGIGLYIPLYGLGATANLGRLLRGQVPGEDLFWRAGRRGRRGLALLPCP